MSKKPISETYEKIDFFIFLLELYTVEGVNQLFQYRSPIIQSLITSNHATIGNYDKTNFDFSLYLFSMVLIIYSFGAVSHN